MSENKTTCPTSSILDAGGGRKEEDKTICENGGEKVSKVPDVHKNNGNPTEKDNTIPNKDVKNKLALKESKSTFPYTSPAWGGTPPSDKKYRLTVLKEGMVRDTIDLSG